jgi:hypothetical protein
MISYTLFIFTFLLLTVQGLQINFSAIKPVDTNLMTIKDTAQAHYESIIDDVLSQHNEGLLTELSIVIKDPHDMYSILKPQADLLADSIQGKESNHNFLIIVHSSFCVCVIRCLRCTDARYDC